MELTSHGEGPDGASSAEVVEGQAIEVLPGKQDRVQQVLRRFEGGADEPEERQDRDGR